MPEDLAEVVAGRQQSPFATGPVLTAQRQFTAILAGHNLAEYGFDNGLAAAVGGAAGFGPQLAGHALTGRGVLWDASARCGADLLVVGQTTGGHERVGAVLFLAVGRGRGFASEQYPASTSACLGWIPVFAADWSSIMV